MYSYQRLLSSCPFLLLMMLAGCGGGSAKPAPLPTPPPITGPFSNASLSGPYAFVFSGTGASGFFAVAGSFQANGRGNLVSGTMDINSGAGVSNNVLFTGTYNVIPNGQGSATLLSAAQSFNVRFVIISSVRALISRFDSNSAGHGSIDLQDPAKFSMAAVSGQFAYTLLGVNASGRPLASVGGFNTDGAGAVSAGLHDVNDNGTPTTNQPLTGTYTVAGSANGRGTLTLNTSLGALHFAFYIVAANQLKLIETERAPAMAGETFSGFSGSISVAGCGPCVFVWNGVSGSTPFAAAGMYSPDDNGGIFGGPEDVNNGSGLVAGTAIGGGTYTFSPQFRGSINFTQIVNFNLTVTSTFAIYPSSSGVLMLETDSGKVISGVARNVPLAGTPHLDLSFDGPYGFNFVGMAFNGQSDEIGQVTTQDPNLTGGGPVTGGMDINNGGSVTTGVIISGDFTMDKTARGTITLQTSAGTQHFKLYACSGFLPVFFVSADGNLTAAGIFERQQ